METTTNATDSVAQIISIRGVAGSAERLTDAELLAGTRRLVGRSNQLLAELLAQLGEVEARGIHRARACSSLYAYCIYELRFSEDEAFRRVAAARLTRRFPALLEAVASGELHLTGLLMLGPHLTELNLTEVLLRAKHRTKREVARLLRVLDPLPAVPARIEPLGPAPARLVPNTPTWEVFAQSMCPVRELATGDRPREWTECGDESADGSPHESADEQVSSWPTAPEGGEPSKPWGPDLPAAPARLDAAPDAPERYKVQFTASAEYVRLVDEAKALLSHAVPRVTLEELHLRALRALVSGLTKKKYASNVHAVSRQQRNMPRHASEPRSVPTVPNEPHSTRTNPYDARSVPPHPRQRVRHIPAVVRRAVFERDGSRCTYVADSGERCAETHLLEFHHVVPFAAGGAHGASNVTLRCAAHNALAAEEDFGRELVGEKRLGGAHERAAAMREELRHLAVDRSDGR